LTKIEFTNASQVMASLNNRVKNIEATLEKTAKQMGVLATNEIHPLTHKVSSNWDSSIHATVKKLGPMKYELWVGSKGAFSGGKTYGSPPDNNPIGYNYGARQERLFHPIEMGRIRAEAPMKDLFQRNITAGLGGRSITQNIASSGIDEMASMAGF
jgi:hypothetical protein